jgi:hypothetical protein
MQGTCSDTVIRARTTKQYLERALGPLLGTSGSSPPTYLHSTLQGQDGIAGNYITVVLPEALPTLVTLCWSSPTVAVVTVDRPSSAPTPRNFFRSPIWGVLQTTGQKLWARVEPSLLRADLKE